MTACIDHAPLLIIYTICISHAHANIHGLRVHRLPWEYKVANKIYRHHINLTYNVDTSWETTWEKCLYTMALTCSILLYCSKAKVCAYTVLLVYM